MRKTQLHLVARRVDTPPNCAQCRTVLAVITERIARATRAAILRTVGCITDREHEFIPIGQRHIDPQIKNRGMAAIVWIKPAKPPVVHFPEAVITHLLES